MCVVVSGDANNVLLSEYKCKRTAAEDVNCVRRISTSGDSAKRTATRFIRIHNLCSPVFLNNATVKCKILNRRIRETWSYENLNFAAGPLRGKENPFPGVIGNCTLTVNVTRLPTKSRFASSRKVSVLRFTR